MAKKKGQHNYSKEEVNCMLTLLEKYLPIEQEEWDVVLDAHNSYSEDWCGRDILSLKRKYHLLRRMKPPLEILTDHQKSVELSELVAQSWRDVISATPTATATS